MKHKSKKYLVYSGLVLAIIIIGIIFWKKDELWLWYEHRKPLPEAQTASQAEITTQDTSSKAPVVQTEVPETIGSSEGKKPLPASYNLKVPFTTQAPFTVWDHKDEEACEETALLMINRFYSNRGISGPEDARAGIDEIINWEQANLGGVWESTNVDEILQIAKGMLHYQSAHIIKNPTVDDIKKAVAAGNPVLVPAAGRELHNPFFKSPGPVYHALVIKGYDESEFITNDPGTRRGADYRYKYQTVLDANHDWNGGNVASGEKSVIVLK